MPATRSAVGLTDRSFISSLPLLPRHLLACWPSFRDVVSRQPRRHTRALQPPGDLYILASPGTKSRSPWHCDSPGRALGKTNPGTPHHAPEMVQFPRMQPYSSIPDPATADLEWRTLLLRVLFLRQAALLRTRRSLRVFRLHNLAFGRWRGRRRFRCR